jgi:hypothetical protein
VVGEVDAQLAGHQRGVSGGREQVIEAGEQRQFLLASRDPRLRLLRRDLLDSTPASALPPRMRPHLSFLASIIILAGCSGGGSGDSSTDGGSSDSSTDGIPDAGEGGVVSNMDASCGAASASCAANSACCSGHCNLFGHCAPVGCHPGGASCSSASDCCSNQCDADGTCAYELGAACTETDVCVDNEFCYQGICSVSVCAKKGAHCAGNSPCCTSTYFCGGSGTCVLCVVPGGKIHGAQCNLGSECCSGSCPAGLCD